MVVAHHVFAEQTVRREGGDPLDPRNALMLGAPYVMGGNQKCDCHAAHHHPGVRDTRLPRSIIPAAALEFGTEALGEGPAKEYLRRRYR